MTSKGQISGLVRKLRKKQTNRCDFEKARKGARPQIKEVSNQTDVTSKRNAVALVLKLRKRANKLT